MAPRKTAPSSKASPQEKPPALKAKRPYGLPDQLERPEVLLACFYRLSVSALSDRPGDVEALLRAAVGTPPEAARQRALARPLRNHIGIVRWSEVHQCLWFSQGRAAPFLVHPSRITAEQRAHVATVEPRSAIRKGHAVEHPREDTPATAPPRDAS